MNNLGTGLAEGFSMAGDAFVAAIQNAIDPNNWAPDGREDDGESIGAQERRLGRDLNNNGIIGAATGFMGTVTRPTEFMTGEVANEHVTVLKNPKRMMGGDMGFGGGGMNVGGITIIVNGGGTEGTQNAAMLAEPIARKVEERLMQKTNLLGIRRN